MRMYSFVFLPDQIPIVKQTDHVLNLVYWKGQPAMVSEGEIKAIKAITVNHTNIKLLPAEVIPNDVPRLIDRPAYSIDGNVVSIKNEAIKVNLPSLGYTLVAELEKETVVGREITFLKKELSLQ